MLFKFVLRILDLFHTLLKTAQTFATPLEHNLRDLVATAPLIVLHKSRRLRKSIEHGSFVSQVYCLYTAMPLRSRGTQAQVFIKTDSHSARVRRVPNYLHNSTHTKEVSRVLVWVNERESVTKFHFPFWQRRAPCPPRSSTFERGGWDGSSASSSRNRHFHF